MGTSRTTPSESVTQGVSAEPITITTQGAPPIPPMNIVLQFAACLAVVVLNVLVTMAVRRWKELSKPTKLLFQHIAYSDILIGSANIVKLLLVLFGFNTQFTCVFPLSVVICSWCCSMSLLLLLGIHTYHEAKVFNNSIGQMEVTTRGSSSEKRLLKTKVMCVERFLFVLYKLISFKSIK